jgi:hypothetical protein
VYDTGSHGGIAPISFAVVRHGAGVQPDVVPLKGRLFFRAKNWRLIDDTSTSGTPGPSVRCVVADGIGPGGCFPTGPVHFLCNRFEI